MTTNTFLIIAGAVVVAGYLIFKFLLKLYGKPILEISLSPLDHPRWSERQKVTDLIDSFLRNGFEAAGNYQCWEIPSLMISGFIRPSEQIAGVIYDHPTSGIWVDCYVQYTDGGSLTVSNAPAGQEMDHMPQQTKIYCTGSSVDELLKRLRAESRRAERLTITKEEFASHFEDSYQKEMKWRMDRGGPSPLEIMRVANTMGESLDTERLQNATQTIDETWMKEKGKPWKKKSVLYAFALPSAFQQPETFRRRMEQQSAPIPQLSVPALPVYLVFIIVLACWCYYGYQYNETHYPLSITAIIVFFLVVIVLVLIMMTFREYHRRVRMCPLLKRMADRRPGAFLVIEGSSPSLFYAREKWIGKVNFKEGGESETASTRLDAVTEYSMGSLEIVRASLLGKVFWSEKGTLPLPESDFSRKFKVSAPDPPVAGKLLNPAISDAVLQLDKFDRPFVKINDNALSIQVDEDLSRPRKETELSEFLVEAEDIVEATVRQAAQSANRR